MKIIYESEDGNQFDTFEECKEYEDRKTNALNHELALYILYDEEWNIIPTTLENIEDNYNISTYIKVKSPTEALLNNEFGLCLPTEMGVYRYDEGWINGDRELHDFLHNWHIKQEIYDIITTAFIKHTGD